MHVKVPISLFHSLGFEPVQLDDGNYKPISFPFYLHVLGINGEKKLNTLYNYFTIVDVRGKVSKNSICWDF